VAYPFGYDKERRRRWALLMLVSGYIAIISFLAALEDLRAQERTHEEAIVRQQLKTSEIDLLPYASRGWNQSDPCVHVRSAAAQVGGRMMMAEAKGRRLISATEFAMMHEQDSIPRLPNGVPMILHQTWWSRKLKEKNLVLSSSWLRCMPDFLHVLWDDDEALQLFKDYRPDLVPMMEGYPYGVQRSDVFRYLVLWVYGGLYTDMDYECIQDITDSEGIGSMQHSVFISAAPNPSVDGLAQNTLMASTRGDPFWNHVLETSHMNCGRMYEPELMIRTLVLLGACDTAFRLRPFFGWTGISVLYTTGPKMLSDAINTYSDPETISLLDVRHYNGQMDRGAKDSSEAAEDLNYPCATHAIHRNAAGWTKGGPFPYTDQRLFGKRIPHRLIAILLTEVLLVCLIIGCRVWWASANLGSLMQKDAKVH